MSSKFTQFVLHLCKDKAKLDSFVKDPDSVLKDSELTYAEQTLLKTMDENLIRSAMGDEPHALMGTVLIFTAASTVTQR
ncbi:MAG: hypothetical protein K2X77_10790 [Candidatus Obscuribacterales bacterium]|nr:hypothetical protein [Candidatus Obscuribacterales bacterium]